MVRAERRARHIAAGSPLTVERDNDKDPVIALREIAERTVDVEELHDALIRRMQKHVEIDEPEEEQQDFDMSVVEMGLGDGDEPMVAVDALAASQEKEDEAEVDGPDAQVGAPANAPDLLFQTQRQNVPEGRRDLHAVRDEEVAVPFAIVLE